MAISFNGKSEDCSPRERSLIEYLAPLTESVHTSAILSAIFAKLFNDSELTKGCLAFLQEAAVKTTFFKSSVREDDANSCILRNKWDALSSPN